MYLNDMKLHLEIAGYQTLIKQKYNEWWDASHIFDCNSKQMFEGIMPQLHCLSVCFKSDTIS